MSHHRYVWQPPSHTVKRVPRPVPRHGQLSRQLTAGNAAVLAVSAITSVDGFGAAVYDGKVRKELEERR